jgi:hypothetical protein
VEGSRNIGGRSGRRNRLSYAEQVLPVAMERLVLRRILKIIRLRP